MIPPEYLVFAKVACERAAYDVLHLVRRNSGSGPLCIEIALAEHAPLAESLSRDQAATKLLPLLHFSLAHNPPAASKRSEDVPAFFHDGAHLLRVCGDGMIPSFHILVEREVFLNQAGANCDCRKWDRRSQRMVAKPYRAVESSLQHFHVAQVNRLVLWRIDRNAVQQNDLIISLAPDGVNRLLHLTEGGHSSRDDDGTLLTCDVLEQREMHHIHRRNFKERHIQRIEQVHLFRGERSRAKVNSLLHAARMSLGMLVRGELIGSDHFAQRSEMLLLVGVRGVPLVLFLGDERFVSPRLKLDGIGAALCGCINQLSAEIHISIMV